MVGSLGCGSHSIPNVPCGMLARSAPLTKTECVGKRLPVRVMPTETPAGPQRMVPATWCQIYLDVREHIAWNAGSAALCGRPLPSHPNEKASGPVRAKVTPVTMREGGVMQ